MNYVNDLKKAQEEMTIARIGMNLCFELLEFKNPLLKKIAEMQYNKVSLAEELNIKKEMNSLKTILSNSIDLSKSNNDIDYLSIKEKINSEMNKNGIDLQSKVQNRMLDTIRYNSTINALEIFTEQYIEALSKYNYYQRKQIEEPSKQKESHTNSDNKQDDYSSMSEEELKNSIIASIEKHINNQENYGDISEQLERQLVQLYPSLKEKNKYFSLDILKKGIELSSIAARKKFNYIEIANAAVLTFEIVTKDLLYGSNEIETPEIFRKVGISDSLEKYEQIYNKYMKFYNNLSAQEQEWINNNLKTNIQYQKLFGEGIVSPKEMKNHINQYISNYIIKNKDSFINDSQALVRISHAVKYMNLEEVKMVYQGIVSEDSKNPYNQRMSQEKMGIIQEIFGEVSLDKIDETQVQTSKTDSNEVTERDRKIAAIIVNLFKEEPISKKYKQISQKDDLTSLYQSLFEQHDSKKNTTPSIFGLERVMNSFKNLQRWALSKMIGTDQDTYQGGYTKK